MPSRQSVALKDLHRLDLERLQLGFDELRQKIESVLSRMQFVVPVRLVIASVGLRQSAGQVDVVDVAISGRPRVRSWR